MFNHYRSLFFFLFFCLILSSQIYSQEDQEKDQKTATLPNPIKLEPNWWEYYDVEPSLLKKRAKKQFELLTQFLETIENPEDKQTAESLIQEINTRLNLLYLLKQQEVEPSDFVWVPKEEYTLQDYLTVSDKIHNINQQINREELEYEQKNAFLNEFRQMVHNNLVEYLALPELSKEKFFKGLQGMAQRLRARYLDIEKELLEKKIQDYRNLVNQLRVNKTQIVRNLDLNSIDSNQLNEEIAEAKKIYRKAHKKLLELEDETVQLIAEDENHQESTRLINQKMISFHAQETLYQTRIATLEAMQTLSEISKTPKEISYQDLIAPWQKFYRNSIDQLKRWEKTTANEIDFAANALIAQDKEKTSTYEESLQTALYSMALMDELSRELSHLDLVIGLIKDRIPETVSFVNRIGVYFSYSMDYLILWIDDWRYYSIFDVGGTPISIFGIFQAILIFVMAVLLSKFSRKWLKRLAKRRGKVAEPSIYTISRVLHYSILFMGLMFALSSLGLTMNNITIILGALGVGVGFGLQNIVNNFLCGLTILFERNLKVGDLIELETGHFGTITEINVQSATVHTYDGIDVLVPNSDIIGKQVINLTKRDPYLRLHVPFGVAYGTDQDLIHDVVCEAAKEVQGTLTGIKGVPEPNTWLVAFGESSLDFELVVWVNLFKCSGRTSLKAGYLSVIEKALKKHGITIPFPQRDLYLKSVPENLSKKDFGHGGNA